MLMCFLFDLRSCEARARAARCSVRTRRMTVWDKDSEVIAEETAAGVDIPEWRA